MNKIENQILSFEGGGVLKLEVLDDGVNLVFTSPHFGEQYKIVSMNVVLTQEEAEKISGWLGKVLSV